MGKYVRAIFWIALFIIAVAALAANLVDGKKAQYLSAAVAVIFTAVFSVKEVLRILKK